MIYYGYRAGRADGKPCNSKPKSKSKSKSRLNLLLLVSSLPMIPLTLLPIVESGQRVTALESMDIICMYRVQLSYHYYVEL